MSLVSSRLSLTHRASIERPVSAGVDGWNQPTTPVWQPHLTALPCRFAVRTGRGSGSEEFDATAEVVVEDLRLICQLGTDITPADRIAAVTHRGLTIVDGPVSIRAVLLHDDHLELILIRIS